MMRNPKSFAVLGITGLGGLALLAFFVREAMGSRPENQSLGKFPEKIVYVRTNDDVVDAGVVFTAATKPRKKTAVLWFHGWGANFYLPSYIGIGRALAERGFTTISCNTRMHDIGNVEKYEGDKRIRGGGYWGVTSEDARDIAAWIDYAERVGFKKVILVGHSAGWASVGRYQVDHQDSRVVGLVLASGMTGIATGGSGGPDPTVVKAKELVDAGRSEELIPLPNRNFPSYISAGTVLDDSRRPAEFGDFFGIKSSSPAALRIHCPFLAFFGDNGDIAGQTELDLVKASLKRLKGGPTRVDIATIRGGDHEYNGQEEQVANVIASWAAKL